MGERKYYERIMPDDVKGGGVVRFMAAAEGYVMVRRAGCQPFVVSTRDWNGWKMADTHPARAKETGNE